MIDKVQKIREEVERLKSQLLRGACSSQVAMETRCKEEAYNEVLAILDSLQEEPVKDRLTFKAIPRLLDMIEPSERAKSYVTKLADAFDAGGYHTDAKIVRESLKIMNGEKVPMATMDEEPVSEDLEEEIEKYMNALYRNWTEDERLKDSDVEELCKQTARHFTNWQKQKDSIVSEDLEEAAEEYSGKSSHPLNNAFKAGAKWQKTKDESTTEDLGEYIDKLSKQFPEVSFAKLSRIAVRVAKWQKEHLWKPADGDDLPEIDREVIALLDNGKVVFAHRPPEFWDGKNIITGEVTRNYPKTYDKGGWNIPNIKYWLDCLMPKEIEL